MNRTPHLKLLAVVSVPAPNRSTTQYSRFSSVKPADGSVH